MKIRILIQLHSIVDVITNSSTELFTIVANKREVYGLIYEFLVQNDLIFESNKISIKTLDEFITENVGLADKDYYYFFKEKTKKEYLLLKTFDEKYQYILEDLKDYYSNEKIDLSKENSPHNIIVISLDQSNRELIDLIKKEFPNLIY